MNILEKIVVKKRKSLAVQKDKIKLMELENLPLFTSIRPSFIERLSKNKPAIIAEFKRKSPSKGDIHLKAKISQIIPTYSESGASAISVLTDDHFGGELTDIFEAFQVSKLPLLRKDFIIDEYQIVEARAHGASAILLIASILTKAEIRKFTSLANAMEMDVLLELHNERELDKVDSGNNIIGINNRNLTTFEVDTDHAIKLSDHLSKDVIKVAESGIQDVSAAVNLFQAGFDAFLIGELFMKTEDPGKKASEFISELNKIITDES